jgi:hypothetical protein
MTRACRQLLLLLLLLNGWIGPGCGSTRLPAGDLPTEPAQELESSVEAVSEPAVPAALDPETLDARSIDAARQRGLESIQAEEIQEHVDLLASDAMRGRWARGSEILIAAHYIADQFAQDGLQPAGDDGTWFQALDHEQDLAPNVVGVLPGRGDGWIVIGAHYDHLRPRNFGSDQIFNGADDNASGTAALLELAGALGGLQGAHESSVVLVAFTAEELGLLGSIYFVAHPPAELDQLRAAINLDMISRGEENLIFCEGGVRSPWLRDVAIRANQQIRLDLRHDEHPEWISASDHFPFMQRGVPTLYFGVEDHADYHRVSDHADRILPRLAESVARLVFLIAVDVAGDAPD